MKKTFIFIASIAIILILSIFYIKDKLNINKILNNFENNNGISIKLKDQKKWSFYPNLNYENSLSIRNKNGDLFIENSNIKITRDYGIKSSSLIKFFSPSILYKGINFRNSKINSEYYNKFLNINNFTANVIDGQIDFNGYLNLDNKKEIYINGSYNNISLNRILKQINISNWERVKIKLSSSNFSINSFNESQDIFIENLNGEMDIFGSVFFVSTEEERFSAAFLSLLANKFKNILSLSESLNYLLDKFADIPSNISGKIFFNNGVITTNKLLIENTKEKALLSAKIDLKTNTIQSKINLYQDDLIFLQAEINGNIQDPEIFIDGVFTSKEGVKKSQNIKKVFENGIQSIIDQILNIND